jgi:hypothetical protein
LRCFAAFLGSNPVQQLLGGVLQTLPADQAAFLTGRSFFPDLISGPFSTGLTIAFVFAIVATVLAATASWLCREPAAPQGARVQPGDPMGSELRAAVSRSLPTSQTSGRSGVAGAAGPPGRIPGPARR